MARKRRTKAEILASKSEGLGDTVEKVLEATGISNVVKFIAGEDCGCDERKQLLNKIFPYRKPNCMEEWEFEFLNEFFKERRIEISPAEQVPLLKIYNRVLNFKQEPTTCADCWRDIIMKLRHLHDTYANS